MNNKIYNILVNFEGNDSLTSDAIRLVQGDYNSVDFVFQFQINYDLAVFYLVRPDGTLYVTALNNGRLTVNASDNVFNQPGTYEFGVSCYDLDSKLTPSQKGKIKVVSGINVSDEDIENSDNYHILDDLINQVTSLIPTYNANHTEKMNEYNTNHNEKMSVYNSNANNKLEGFNANALQFEEDAESVSGFTFSQWGNSKRLEEHMRNHIALTPDYNTYGVDFPLWETSHSCEGTKTDDNVNYTCVPGTDTIKTVDTYPESWKTYDVNAVVDSNGIRHLTGIKGLDSYKDEGEVDCYVLKRTYWQKIWIEDGHLKIRRRYVPTEGFDICPLAINKDGSWNPFFYKPKYYAGDINGKLYGSKNLIPAHSLNMNASSNPSDEEFSDNVSYSGLVTLAHARGAYYSGGLLTEWYDTLTTFYLKFATRNTQSIMAGNTSNNYQYRVSQVTSNTNRVIISKANANNIDLYSCVSIGDMKTNTNNDRQYAYMHNIAYNARVIGKEDIDANNTALILDHANFTTTLTCTVSTMHERSGFSDLVLGRTGSPISNTNGRHGFVFDGEEHAIGGYEVIGNAFMDIVNVNGNREVYYTNDASKITATVSTAKANYKKSNLVIQSTSLNGWKYITEYGFDTKNGLALPTKSGESGSGSSVGYADGLYVDNGTSGQREFLLFGNLGNGAIVGLSCLYAYYALSNSSWSLLARLSINGVGGELAE